MALKIAEFMGKDVKIRPCSSAHFPLPAPRARSEAMINYKMQLLGMNDLRTWEEALKDYIAELLG
jgi:dTDP-4-dehydrorhamnose reductase